MADARVFLGEQNIWIEAQRSEVRHSGRCVAFGLGFYIASARLRMITPKSRKLSTRYVQNGDNSVLYNCSFFGIGTSISLQRFDQTWNFINEETQARHIEMITHNRRAMATIGRVSQCDFSRPRDAKDRLPQAGRTQGK